MYSNSNQLNIDWPPIPSGRAAALLAMQFRLDQSQWMCSERIENRQFSQLIKLIRHAKKTVPYYRDILDYLHALEHPDALRESWTSIPILTRSEVQNAGPQLHSMSYLKEKGHKEKGQVHTLITSGSTGQPVRCLGTPETQFFWHCITIRDHLWHNRDFSKKLAAIRYSQRTSASPPTGESRSDWGAPIRWINETGPSCILTTDSTVAQQADWLRKESPSYLIAYPSNLKALARWYLDHDWRLPGLLHARSFGEVLETDVRELCLQAWNVPVIDCYSSQEVGYVALQCPQDESAYHIQSECCLAEILDTEGRPCRPGEIGRVVVTPLHNGAMPLIRYDLGDFAEVGEPCRCGRGLPVLKRIVGRQRNMLTYPDGQQRWPGFGHGIGLERLPAIRQFQIAQVALDRLEVRLAQPEPFSQDQEDRITKHLQEVLAYPHQIVFRYMAQIPRGATGKFEEFRSELEEKDSSESSHA